MKCPNCGYELWKEYEDALQWDENNEWIKISNYRSFFDGEYSGHQWEVECKCPRCECEWYEWDQDV